mmetsp:Transcript_45344/g.145403  ORF Transcript_45344/g.145403 Transcript_45344/m.145403 type:complete len:200 (-) Transcript_45344:2767-3366(-)
MPPSHRWRRVRCGRRAGGGADGADGGLEAFQHRRRGPIHQVPGRVADLPELGEVEGASALRRGQGGGSAECLGQPHLGLPLQPRCGGGTGQIAVRKDAPRRLERLVGRPRTVAEVFSRRHARAVIEAHRYAGPIPARPLCPVLQCFLPFGGYGFRSLVPDGARRYTHPGLLGSGVAEICGYQSALPVLVAIWQQRIVQE